MIAIPFTMRDDDEINRLRHAVLYGGYKNSLVEWTLSDEWLTPHTVPMTGERGVVLVGNDYTFVNAVNGEFTATLPDNFPDDWGV